MLSEPTVRAAVQQNPTAPAPIWPVIVSWGAQLGVAVILAQTLFFKFSYAPETQAIFGPRGGRPAATLAAMVELVCVLLLLIPPDGGARRRSVPADHQRCDLHAPDVPGH